MKFLARDDSIVFEWIEIIFQAYIQLISIAMEDGHKKFSCARQFLRKITSILFPKFLVLFSHLIVIEYIFLFFQQSTQKKKNFVWNLFSFCDIDLWSDLLFNMDFIFLCKEESTILFFIVLLYSFLHLQWVQANWEWNKKLDVI